MKMFEGKGAEYFIRIILIVFIIHSFMVGLLLIIWPVEYLSLFGYENYQGSFFKMQGGVFHIAMCLVYYGAIKTLERGTEIAILAYQIKFLAAIFLFSYYIFIEHAWIVGLSGLGDLSMGTVLWISVKATKND